MKEPWEGGDSVRNPGSPRERVGRAIAALKGARWGAHALLLMALVLTGCGPGAQSTAAPQAGSGTTAPSEARPLVIFVRVEPSTLATRSFVRKSAGLFFVWRVFNAMPAVIDGHGVPQPELLASLPQLNTDSWQVFPDGTMRTTYTLRPNLTWHDGQPLT